MAAEIVWPRMDPNPLAGATCQHCDTHGQVYVELRRELAAHPVGSFSLAGAQMKLSATGVEWPYAVCGQCSHVSRGER